MIAKSKKIKKQNNYQAVIASAVIFLLFFSAIGFLIYSNWRINARRTELISQIKQLQGEIQISEKKNQDLKDGISQASSESHLEEVARSTLGLKKPGEEVAVILPPPQKSEEPQKAENKGFWQRLFNPVRNFFGGL